MTSVKDKGKWCEWQVKILDLILFIIIKYLNLLYIEYSRKGILSSLFGNNYYPLVLYLVLKQSGI